jgi:hypothetical protein
VIDSSLKIETRDFEELQHGASRRVKYFERVSGISAIVKHLVPRRPVSPIGTIQPFVFGSLHPELDGGFGTVKVVGDSLERFTTPHRFDHIATLGRGRGTNFASSYR